MFEKYLPKEVDEAKYWLILRCMLMSYGGMIKAAVLCRCKTKPRDGILLESGRMSTKVVQLPSRESFRRKKEGSERLRGERERDHIK